MDKLLKQFKVNFPAVIEYQDGVKNIKAAADFSSKGLANHASFSGQLIHSPTINTFLQQFNK